MPFDEYLKKFGNPAVSENLQTAIEHRLFQNADKIREDVLENKAISFQGECLKVADVIRIPLIHYRRFRIGLTSLEYIQTALNKNDLKLGMSEREIKNFVDKFDINIAQLKTVLTNLCVQIRNEKKRDLMRMYERKTELVPGFECYVLISKV